MTQTLLVDLDDTLLGNKMETFIPAYLGALGLHMADYVSPEKMIEVMLKATQSMFDNRRPDRTLKSCFDPEFYPQLGLEENEVQDHIQSFYKDIFPTLESRTKFRPEAVEFIENAFSQDYQIVIATNPVFPLTAIYQRLEWAKLSPAKYPYLLIPSYETFHFTKPDPAYFAEILTMIGWPQGPIIMVGNDVNHDVIGGKEMGIPVFWITDGETQTHHGQNSPTGSGKIDEVHQWIGQQEKIDLLPDFSSISAIVATLRGSPAGLSNLLSGIPKEDWSKRPKKDEWCLTEIICHLRDVEKEINLPRIKKILIEDNPFIPGIDSDSWAVDRDYINQDGMAAFPELMAARIETLELLDEIEENVWSRPARHAIFGPTNFKEIVYIIASHERLHVRQIHEVID